MKVLSRLELAYAYADETRILKNDYEAVRISVRISTIAQDFHVVVDRVKNSQRCDRGFRVLERDSRLSLFRNKCTSLHKTLGKYVKNSQLNNLVEDDSDASLGPLERYFARFHVALYTAAIRLET
jgi:hypothetical protein